MDSLRHILKKPSRLIIGLMSGTSADGIDAVVVRVRGNGIGTKFTLVEHVHHPYPRGFGEYLLANSLPGSSSVDAVARLNALLGQLFADAAHSVSHKSQIPLTQIDLIGSHGQTIHHLPDAVTMFGKEVRATLQIGDPSVISALTGITTVGDFRTADVAVGGQGAPLVPFLDFVAFRTVKLNRIALNIGGIANITMLPKNCRMSDVTAFDTGPGNMLIDTYCRIRFGMSHDEGGQMAMHGDVNEKLLRSLMSHPFLKRKPPKSTGREVFGEGFLHRLLRRTGRLSDLDTLATLSEFAALSIYEAIVKFGPGQLDEVIASGGGIHNATLMRSLAIKLSPARLLTSDTLGVPSDAKEAILMALLANEAIHSSPANLPRVTGAKKAVVLGKICL